MKKALLGLLLILIIFSGFALNVDAAVSVRGYYRKNGTYVQPHYRSDPNSNPYDNWSFPGNTNPYTGKVAPGNPSTYLKNYYNSSSKNYSSSYTSPYYSPSYSSSYYGGSTYTSSNENYMKDVYGGYKIGDVLFCNSGYYESGKECLSAPSNSTAYGGTTFYCDSGYEKKIDRCVEKTYNNYNSSSYSSSYSRSNAASAVLSTDTKCPEGSSWYLNQCIKKLDNAKYNGSTYTCNKDFFVNKTGDQCIGIDSWCKEQHGIRTWGENGKCYCNQGSALDSITNMCVPQR